MTTITAALSKLEAFLKAAARGPLEDFRSFCAESKKTFFALFFIYALGISAIIRANFFYADDLRRALTGEPIYNNGRLLSNYLSVLIHTSQGVWDTSPLPQLITMALMAVAGCAVIRLLSEKKGFSLWTVLAVVPMGLSPYFLECVSYKFDAPYMAVSILASILPFLSLKYGLLPYCAASVAGGLIMCTTYQAASGIYPMRQGLRFCEKVREHGGRAEFVKICGAGHGKGCWTKEAMEIVGQFLRAY